MRHVCSLAALSLSFSGSRWRSRFIDGTVWQAKQSYKRQTHEALQVLLVLHSSCCIRRRCCCLLAQHFVYIWCRSLREEKKANWRSSRGQKQLELIAVFNCILVLVSSSDACAVFVRFTGYLALNWLHSASNNSNSLDTQPLTTKQHAQQQQQPQKQQQKEQRRLNGQALNEEWKTEEDLCGINKLEQCRECDANIMINIHSSR